MVDRICDNCMNRVPIGAEKCPRCGILFENTNPGGALPNGLVLGGRYTIGRYLEIDGEGVTYSAIDGNTLQRVQIKEFMPVTLCASRDADGNLVAKPGCEVLFKTTRMDFSELYANILRLGFTEGLVQVLDLLEENNTAYAVLEKIEGPTLTEYLLRQEGPLSHERALAILQPALNGVETLHAAGVVHRGVSPDNIILESGGTAKLTGYATLALRQQGSELKSKLYPGYSAPEQYTAAEFEDRYTDIYALGAVLYRMLTGERPESADERKVQDNLQPARVLNKELPAFLSTALQRAMRMNASERIQNVGDLRLALSGEASRTPAAKTPEKGLFGLTKQQTIVGGIVLGVVVLILLIVLMVSIFNKDGRKDPDSLSLSVSISVDETLVPDFTGMPYDRVIKNKDYTDVYTFGEPEEEYDKEVKKGNIISQTPKAKTQYKEGTEIIFVVSKGAQPIALPDFAAQGMTKDEAIAELKNAGFADADIAVVSETNNGKYPENAVIKTEPAAGAEVAPGEDSITLYIAAEASTTNMLDLSALNRAEAEAALTEAGFDLANVSFITTANGRGRGVNGQVAATEPAFGTPVSPGSQKVTIKLYENYKMPNLNSELGGKTWEEAKKYCDERGIPYNPPVESGTGGTPGTVAEVYYTSNVEVTDVTVVTIYLYSEAQGNDNND